MVQPSLAPPGNVELEKVSNRRTNNNNHHQQQRKVLVKTSGQHFPACCTFDCYKNPAGEAEESRGSSSFPGAQVKNLGILFFSTSPHQPTSKFYWLLHQEICTESDHFSTTTASPTLGILISCLDLPAVFLFMPWTHNSHFLTHWSLTGPLKPRGRCCHFFPQNPLWRHLSCELNIEITRRFYTFCHCLHLSHTGLLAVQEQSQGLFLSSFLFL